MNVCLCVACVPGACGGQRRVSDHLEVELQIIVNHRVVAEPGSSAGVAVALNS